MSNVPAHFPFWSLFLLLLVKSTRTHMYFCMKNSPASEDDFREDLLTVIDHYQVKNFELPFERALAHEWSKHRNAIILLLLIQLNCPNCIQWVTQTLTDYYEEYSSFIGTYYLDSLLPFYRATTTNAMKDHAVNQKGMSWAKRRWLRQGP